MHLSSRPLKPLSCRLQRSILPLLLVPLGTTAAHAEDPAAEDGFTAIFDGQTLAGWKGDPVYWRVQDGCIVGEITPETIVKRNTFLIWQDGQPADFELKLEYRITKDGNSGVNYRSEIMGDHPFALTGYQADIDGRNRYTGQNYEERGRTTLAYLGQVTVIPPRDQALDAAGRRKFIKKNNWTPTKLVKSLGTKESLTKGLPPGQWHEMHIVAQGNRLRHFVNGVLMSDVTDNDPHHRRMAGSIGVQVHVGPPMKVEFRKIRLKEAPPKPWRFVSMPDFLNVDTDYPQPGWEDALGYILESVKKENPDFLVVPGDLVMGEWHFGKNRSKAEGIAHYAKRYYPAWKKRLQAHGLQWYAALGDHEIGDNPWNYKGAPEVVAAYKKEFREHMGMPLNGPEHMQGTAFSWKHKNALFISVDVFETGSSRQGSIRTGVTGRQLAWMEHLIDSSPEVDHVIVMGHAPCLGPVRQWSSSGLMVTGGRDSAFWQSMAKRGVALYLAGEVHAITCTERDGVQQIAHGGLIGYNTRTNYLVADVYPDRLELVIKEIDMVPSGPKLWQPGGNRPLEKVAITPAMKQRGFIPVASLTIDTAAKPRQFKNPRGYFLKRFESSTERGSPSFKGGNPLPRINLDGSVGDQP